MESITKLKRLGAPYTEADDIALPREAATDAVRCHFDEEKMPRIIRGHLVKEEVAAA